MNSISIDFSDGAFSDGASTSATLLSGLRDPRNRKHYELCWKRFCEVYTPSIYTYCRKKGLSHHDAEDVTSELMAKLSKALQRFAYDDSLTFRGWLRRATTNAVISFWRSEKPLALMDQHALELHNAPEELAARLEREFDRELEAVARQRVRATVSERDWEIFCLLAETDSTATEIAQKFELSRCMR